MSLNRPLRDREVALRHPVYLDTPMMTSFLAYLADGVAEKAEHTTNSTHKSEAGKAAGGEVGLTSNPVAKLNFNGRFSDLAVNEASDVLRLERRHTEASLFNVLLDALHEQNLISEIPGSVDELHPGALIRVRGSFLGNPLEDYIRFAMKFVPFFGEEGVINSHYQEPNPRSGNPAKKAAKPTPSSSVSREEKLQQQFTVELIKQLNEDVTSGPVADILVRCPGFNLVVTASREFFTEQAAARLKSAHVSVVGKVTSTANEAGSLSLTRRTILATLGEDEAQEMLSSVSSISSPDSANDIKVAGPYIQVMPLAIYI